MNRLIIIGNGFDLAHGIKTSYKDFIASYLCYAINTFFEKRNHSDKLLKLELKSHFTNFDPKPKPVNTLDVFDIFDKINSSRDIRVTIHSSVLKNSLHKIETMNWVDLEIEYFEMLLATKHAHKDNNQLEAIQEVNEQLEYMKERLIEYLTEQQSYFTNGFDKKALVDCFTEAIFPHEIVTVKLKEKQLPKNLYFLNFNYTNTFENYMNECKKVIPCEFNYIHGNLYGAHGTPIFGFGDELDKRYLEFEDEKNNELFKHIKSFEYLKTKNYFLLTSFIESDDFQVHIYGHSCGLSDRTMLNQIFEHENCKSIKIFYHKIDDKTNDYTEKTYEMSRHFKDKGMMRKKVISFDRSSEMPQPK